MKVLKHAEICADRIVEGPGEAGLWRKAVCDGCRCQMGMNITISGQSGGNRESSPNIRASVNLDNGMVIDRCVAGLNK